MRSHNKTSWRRKLTAAVNGRDGGAAYLSPDEVREIDALLAEIEELAGKHESAVVGLSGSVVALHDRAKDAEAELAAIVSALGPSYDADETIAQAVAGLVADLDAETARGHVEDGAGNVDAFNSLTDRDVLSAAEQTLFQVLARRLVEGTYLSAAGTAIAGVRKRIRQGGLDLLAGRGKNVVNLRNVKPTAAEG